MDLVGGRLTRYDTKGVSEANMLVIPEDEPVLVQQHFADEVDINTIVRRFGMVNELPAWKQGGVYGDFTDVVDLESAIAKIRGVEERFMTLPPEFREKFDNDPGKLVEYAQSVTEAEFEALLRPPVAATPPVVNPPE